MSKLIEDLLPPGYRFRELWLPELIVGSSLLPAVEGGHALALTGAQLGSTVNGLEMRGAELITITDHADIHITDDLTVVLPAFILPVTFDAGAAADMGLMNLNNGAVIARLNSTTGALDFIFNNVDGGADETVSTTKVSWAANTLWQVAFTFVNNGTGVISVRLYINGVAENTNDQVDGAIVVPAGDTILGYDGTTYITGKLQRMFLVYDTAILTEAQLLEVYKGVPYATNLKAYLPLDHPGRGLTMPDRSVGGNCSGTISGTAIANIWDFAGQAKLAALDLDGINDRGYHAGVDISGDLTVVWVGKMRLTYDSLTNTRFMFHSYVAGVGDLHLRYFEASDTIIFSNTATIEYATKPVIDEYLIFLGTAKTLSTVALYVNGSIIGTTTQTLITTALMPFSVGSHVTPGEYDSSKLLLLALIEGALTEKDALNFSRRIRDKYDLPISI